MKKIFFIIAVLLSFAAAAQPGYTRFNTRGNWLAVGADAFNLPGLGTPALATAQIPRAGALIYDSTGGNRGVHVWTGAGWVKIYDTLMSISASNTLQQVINNGPTISTNSTIPLAANLFIGDNIGIEFKNSTSVLELYGATIKLNRGWSGAAGTLGLAAGASTDSVVTINQATGAIRMRNASSFGGGGSESTTASNGLTLSGVNIKLGGSMVDNTTTLSFHGINSILYDSVRNFTVKTKAVNRIEVPIDGNTVLRDSTGANNISVGTSSTGITSNGTISIIAKGPSQINLNDSINIRPLAGDLRIYPLNHNYSPALTVATYDTTNGRVYHTPASLLAGATDTSQIATQNDISLAINCPVIIDTIATEKLIDGIANDMHNAYHSLLFTKPNKTVWMGLREGKSHVYGGIPVLYSSTNYGVSFDDSIHVESDTANNYRGLHLYQKPGSDTIVMSYTSLRNNMGAIDSCVIYVRYSTDNLATYSARYRLMTGDNYSFNEDGMIYFKGKWVQPFYSFSPATNTAGVMTKTSITSGTGWTRSDFPNSTTLELNETQLYTNRTEDSLFALARSETNQDSLYLTKSIDGLVWSTPTAVEIPFWFAGRPSILKTLDGRILMSYRSREDPPVAPDDGRMAISEDDGRSFTVVRQLVHVYYEYGDFLHLGDQDYLHVYSTQVVSTDYKADLYREFLRIPSCGFQGLESKSVEKPGSPIWNYYVNRQITAGVVSGTSLPAGAVGFGNAAGTAITSAVAKLYYDSVNVRLSIGQAAGATGRLNVKTIGSSGADGVRIFSDGATNANAGLSMAAGIFSIGVAPDASPTTHTNRIQLRQTTATGTDEVVNINSGISMLHDGSIIVSKPFLHNTSGLFRIENTGNTAPTNAAGAGLEMFRAGSDSWITSYNRTTAANAPMKFLSSAYSFTGNATFVNLLIGGSGLDIPGTTSGNVQIRTNANAGTWTMTLPTDDGSANQVLTTNGGGTTSWTTPTVGTVTSFSAGDLSPLFTTSEATATTTPALTFALTNATGGTVFGNNTGSSAAPAYTAVPVLGVAGTTKGTLGLAGNTSGVVTIQPAAAAGTWSLTLPTTDGDADQVLTTNGSGVTSWTTQTGSGSGGVLYYRDPLFEPNDSTLGVDSTKMKIWPGSIIAGATMSLGSDADNDMYFRNGTVLARLAYGTTGQYLKATTGSDPSWGGVALNHLIAATATNTINNAGFAQELQWNTLGAATALKLSSTSTAAASNAQQLLSLSLSGANATSTQSSITLVAENLHTGTGSTNMGMYSVASGGATANYGIRAYGAASSVTNYGGQFTASSATTNIGGQFFAYSGTNNYAIDLGGVSQGNGTIRINGNTSGAILIQPAAAAGTYTLTLPTTDGGSGEFLQTDGSGVLTWAAGGGGSGDALVANPLSQFAATTSAQLAGVLSNETGTGVAVFGTSPDFTTAITLGGVAVPTISSTNTLTNKRWTARVGSTTSSATPTINTDVTDIYKLTAQTADITSFTTNLSGTPVDGDILEIQITGTAARALTFGASFVSSTVTIPTTTVTTATLTVIFQWFTTSSYGANKWVCVNSF